MPFVVKTLSTDYVPVVKVPAFCKKRNGVQASLLEGSLIRTGYGRLTPAQRSGADERWLVGRGLIAAGFEQVNGGLAGRLYVGSNKPTGARLFSDAVREYSAEANTLQSEGRLVLPRKHPIARAVLTHATKHDAFVPCPAQNLTPLSLISQGTDKSPFETNKLVYLLFDGHPEVHAYHARTDWKRDSLNVWALTEKDLEKYKLGEDLIELRLSVVGGRGVGVNDVDAVDVFSIITGALPVVHVGARKN